MNVQFCHLQFTIYTIPSAQRLVNWLRRTKGCTLQIVEWYMTLCFLGDFVEQYDEVAQHEEGARRKDEHEHAIGFAPQGDAEDGACAEEFTHSTEAGESKGETETDADAVEDGGDGTVLGCKGFGTAKDDAVHHDEGDEESEALVNVGSVCLNEHLEHRDEAGDDYNISRDAHGIGDEFLDECNDEVAEDEHAHGGETHRHAVDGG